MVEGTKRGAARPRPASEVPAPVRPLVLLRLAIRPGRAVERQSRTVTFEEPGPAVWRGLDAAQLQAEFNTRGMMVTTNYALWQLFWDSNYYGWHMISVWPSGQIYEEY